MLVKTKALVLKLVKYGDTSLIVKVYTSELGAVSLMVNGVRSTKSKKNAAIFQPLSFIDVVIYHKPGQQLLRLKEFQSAYIYKSIPFDIVKTAIVQFLLEVVEQCLREDEQNIALYNFLESQFVALDMAKTNDPNYHINFLMDFMQMLGILPENNYTETTPYFSFGEGSFVESYREQETLSSEDSKVWKEMLTTNSDIQLNKSERKRVTNNIIKYYQFHIHNFRPIKSYNILELVFS